jgi:hypothetical protein
MNRQDAKAAKLKKFQGLENGCFPFPILGKLGVLGDLAVKE